MRAVALGVLVGFVGCSRPAPDESAPVAVAPVVVAPLAVAPAVETAPKPHAVPDDPRWRQRQENRRNGKDAVLRGLARFEIKAGDPIEPLIKLHPDYTVLRSGEFVFLSKEDGYGGTQLFAKGGMLVLARTCSCIFRDEFFNDMTEQECAESWSAYSAALQKYYAQRAAAALDAAIPPPREVGKPAP